MKRLDKFSILIENEEMGREVKRIADKAGVNVKNYDFSYNLQSGHHRNLSTYFFEKGLFCITPKIELFDTYPLITFDQFKEMFEGEIIGYECPMDLYGGEIKKGTIYRNIHNVAWYIPDDNANGFHIPTEIVETWKPVYKQTSKTVMVGGKEWIVDKHGVTCIDKGFDPNDIEKLNLDLIVHIFGPTTTLSEIKNLIDTYKLLNK